MKIYIAGKLSDTVPNYIKNCKIMLYWSNLVRKTGHSPYIPCMDLLLGLEAGDMEYDDYFNMSKEWLMVSDALLLLPNWKESKGARKERQLFKKTKRPIIDLTHQSAWGALRELNNAL